MGDTITSVDGKPVKNGDELVADIASRKPGSKVTLGFVRNGKKQDATVTVADRAKLFAARLGEDDEDGAEEAPKESKLGITVRGISSEMADRLDIPAGKGVIVQDIKPSSFADDVGLTRGDVILEINKQAVNSEDDFTPDIFIPEERTGRRIPGTPAGFGPSGRYYLPGWYTSVTWIKTMETGTGSPDRGS